MIIVVIIRVLLLQVHPERVLIERGQVSRFRGGTDTAIGIVDDQGVGLCKQLGGSGLLILSSVPDHGPRGVGHCVVHGYRVHMAVDRAGGHDIQGSGRSQHIRVGEFESDIVVDLVVLGT